MSLLSTYSRMKASSVTEAQHSEEMADANFLTISFFANTSLGYYKSGHVGEGLAAAFLFTLVQGEHRKYSSAWPPWTQEEETQAFIGGLPGVQDVKNSWWLAGWLAGGHHTCT